MMKEKICIFPNDSLRDYFEKGEIKYGYFNPCNFFDEVHVISLFDDEIEAEKVSQLAGKGKLIIHNIQKVNLTNYHSFEKKIEKIISQINPQIIRAFNPLVQGWLATKIGKKNGIPVVISVHTNYNQQRELLKKERKYFKFLKLSYTSKKIETYCLKNADSIICVYEFIVPYVKKMGGKNIQVIYNKVDLQNFFPEKIPKFKNQIPTIISVGRLIDQKNHMYLLEAIKKMDAKLLIIGNGPNFYKFTNFIKSEGIRDKVEIIKSVPNHKLAEYYTSSDIYAQPMENLGGIPIPVLEAMACGLPIVMSEHDKNYSEIIDESVYFVENKADIFRKTFEKILSNNYLRKELKRKSLETIKKINGEKMELAELQVYKKLRMNKLD